MTWRAWSWAMRCLVADEVKRRTIRRHSVIHNTNGFFDGEVAERCTEAEALLGGRGATASWWLSRAASTAIARRRAPPIRTRDMSAAAPRPPSSREATQPARGTAIDASLRSDRLPARPDSDRHPCALGSRVSPGCDAGSATSSAVAATRWTNWRTPPHRGIDGTRGGSTSSSSSRSAGETTRSHSPSSQRLRNWPHTPRGAITVAISTPGSSTRRIYDARAPRRDRRRASISLYASAVACSSVTSLRSATRSRSSRRRARLEATSRRRMYSRSASSTTS
jgi:hypothetical protein